MSSKGEQTRSRILDRALAIAKAEGLEQLSIGMLADALAMSKSGIFAHFGSKEELQRAVLEEAEARFIESVYRPALSAPRGLARLHKLFELWLDWGGVCCKVCHCCPCTCPDHTHGGCLLIASASEFDDKPGPIRDHLRSQMQRLRDALTRTVSDAIQTGELRPDTDAALLAFQLQALVLAVHHDVRLLGNATSIEFAIRSYDHLLAVASARPTAVPA